MIRKVFISATGSWQRSALRTYVATLVDVVPYWKLTLALVLMLGVTLTQGAQLVLLVPLMDLIGLNVQQGSVGWLADFVSSAFAAVGLKPTLGIVLVIFAVFSALLALVTRCQTVFNYKLQADFTAIMRRRLYRAIANADWLTFARSRASDFTHALTTEMDRIGAVTVFSISLVNSAVLAFIYVAVAMRLSGLMTVLVFVSGAVLLLALRKKTREAQVTGKHISLATNGMYAAAIEHLDSMKTTKSYGAEERGAQLFSGLAGRVARMNLNSIRNQAETRFWFGVGSVVILCAILYASSAVLDISAAGLILLLFLFNRIIPLFSSMQTNYQLCLNVLPAFEGIMSIMKRCEAASESRGGPREHIELRDGVRFESVSFIYAEDEKGAAISDLDLAIRAGETTAIVGPSGAGKSTIADLVLGLILPERGRVLVDDTPLDAKHLTSWRDQIGYVAQDTFLFNDTVKANLLWAHPGAEDDEIQQALELAAADAFVSRLPDGLETVLGDRGVRLSGGEKQRLSLARALLRKPSLLILDEATSALDSENEARIRAAIDGLHGSMTIVIITHRLSTIRGADVIHVLEHGRLVESGGWNELLGRKGGRFAALCMAQGIDGTSNADREIPHAGGHPYPRKAHEVVGLSDLAQRSSFEARAVGGSSHVPTGED